MKTKHTPGPWRIEDINQIVSPEENIVATVYFDGAEPLSEVKANAKLIAAAPELLGAIQYYFDVLEEVRGPAWNEKPDHVLGKMINAIQKATQ